MSVQKRADETRDANLDPISGEPGAHPIGVGAGAAAAGATGAAIGSVAGPIGTVVGAVAGAVVGGLAGKSVAESIDPTAEDAYWRENYSTRPYVKQGERYETYQPAYQYGWETRSKHEGRTFDEVEDTLRSDWESAKDTTRHEWNTAKHAVRDAWDRHAPR